MPTTRPRSGHSARIASSELTPQSVWLRRREFVLAGLAAGLLPGVLRAAPDGAGLSYTRNARYGAGETPNSYEDITTYNNFYEFGTGKEDPARRAGRFRPAPWSLRIEGEADRTGVFALEDILRPHPLEERVYRLRCVEAWSMVVPWVGFPLADLLRRFAPTSRAKYVAFTTAAIPEQMPGLAYRVLDWPYVEGLRIDEAMHPLAFVATGLYGQPLPNQNGAPLRLVLPWKYGFKSIKSIVAIRFTATQPPTSWNRAAPREYGFYANVNPAVDHPRWSQARERRIGAGVFGARRPTLAFNGYAEEVASLYAGMDLRRHF
ncbi:MAG: Protein-methionine-sulfoxide reductase catalytic subunit MsrP [Pseudomonadales bacterium]|nr:Protein-methionine-sulfoxide reductase catalytic subunit MsrP [Pseudomonadales bacterium]